MLEVAGREVTITNPDKVVFAASGATKLDLVRYYLAVADGALRGVAGRPMILKRFPKGIDQEAFFQKRAPSTRPDWIEALTDLKLAATFGSSELAGRAVHRLNGTPGELLVGRTVLLTPADFHEIVTESDEPLDYFNVVVGATLVEDPENTPLPDAVVTGVEPLLVVGAIAGG